MTFVVGVIASIVLIAGMPQVPSQRDLSRLIIESRRMTPDQAAEIEKRLQETPDSLNDRLALLGFYSPVEPAYRTLRRAHVLWLIEKHPDLPLSVMSSAEFRESDPGFLDGRTLWLEHIRTRGNEPAVVSNAARYFMLADQTLAERLLKQGENLEPREYTWPTSLGVLYMLQAREPNRVEYASKAVAAFERAFAVTPQRHYVLPRLTEAAYEAAMWDTAEQYATEASASKDANAMHTGYSFLGELAVRRDDIEAAKQHLLASGRILASPSLGSFGPRMRLAAALLERGERETVVAYLEMCLAFWKSGEDRLKEWIVLIKNGKTPDFGGNAR